MEEAIIARLLASEEVAGVAATRVYPGSRPQGSPLPAAVLTLIDGAPLYADDGEVGLTEARIQIDCWAESYSGAKLLARAVKQRLSAFTGPSGGVHFATILIDAERDLREAGSNAAAYLYRTTIDFIVWTKT